MSIPLQSHGPDDPPASAATVRLRIVLLLGEVALVLGVLAAAYYAFADGADNGFNDPSFDTHYIRRARFFNYLFVQHDISRDEWSDDRWTHIQPMLANYIVGGWLWLHGHDLDNLPGRYDTKLSYKQNILQGTAPERETIKQARAVMVGTATATAGLLYLLGRALGGPIAGLFTASFMLASPLLQRHLSVATGEAPLAFFIVLALLLGVVGAQHSRSGTGSIPIGWALGLGLAAGLGFATKLTAVLGLLAVVGWGLAVGALAASRAGRATNAARVRSAWTAARGWLLAALVAFGVFVLSNPHLYPNPIVHTLHLFEERDVEMREQVSKGAPSDAVRKPLDRPGLVLLNSLIEGTSAGARGLPLEAALAGVGLATLLLRGWRGWRRSGQAPVEGLVLLTVLLYFAGVSAGLRLDWDRYYVPTLVLGSVLSGLGVSAMAGWLVCLARRPRAWLAAASRFGEHSSRAPGSSPSTAAGPVPGP